MFKHLAIFFSFFTLLSYAHEVNTVYYNILEKEDLMYVEASFPWTIREALLNFDPNLKKAISKKEYEIALLKYLKIHFRVYGKQNRPIELLKIYKTKNKGHSHGNDYTFVLKREKIDIIENTILCKENSSQKNIHLYKGKAYETNAKTIKVVVKTNPFYIFWIIALGLVVVISLYKIFKKNELKS